MPFLKIFPGSGGGGGGNPRIIVVPFAYDTPSPLTITAISPGQFIKSTTIQITEVFDDPTATLALGTTSSPSEFLTTAQNRPRRLGDYEAIVNFLVAAAENVILTINPGASTQGQGYIIVDLRSL
jgi:hypothetical protein